MKEIGLVLLGFILGVLPVYLERRRRKRAHWAALSVEVEICARLARTYLADEIASPLYRLPEAAFAVSFPALLADGAITKSEISDLAWFSGSVQDINRGLDNVNSARNSAQNDQLAIEVNRLKMKCRQLLEGHGGSEASVETVRKLLARYVA